MKHYITPSIVLISMMQLDVITTSARTPGLFDFDAGDFIGGNN